MSRTDPRDQFGATAQSYLNSPSHSDAEELAHCVELTRPQGGPILDVGTGAGHLAYAFSPRCSRVVALDVTPEMLEIVESEAAKRGLSNIESCLAPAEALPFPVETFEGVATRTAAHHFDDREAFLDEAFRVTKPGGWLLVVDTTGIEEPLADEGLDRFERERDPSHRRNWPPSIWIQAIGAAGYRIEHTEVVSRRHDFERWLDRMRVEEPIRSRLHDVLVHSEGELRDYLSPEIRDERLTFTLRQITVSATKP
ncbi:MAG TPA: class I SAM-dependent methyltransferase [Fimbriimonadaceae bacterium]|nr:class I SAM-dependent methyltransferase [Fimbriimonadaceae bacterium]